MIIEDDNIKKIKNVVIWRFLIDLCFVVDCILRLQVVFAHMDLPVMIRNDKSILPCAICGHLVYYSRSRSEKIINISGCLITQKDPRNSGLVPSLNNKENIEGCKYRVH